MSRRLTPAVNAWPEKWRMRRGGVPNRHGRQLIFVLLHEGFDEVVAFQTAHGRTAPAQG